MPVARPVSSVVIPAHNEEAVIGRCLRGLLADAAPGEFEVVVAANGCTDATVSRALAVGGVDVRVLDLPEPGKPAALNAADEASTTFPRIYLDADAVLSTAAARELVDLLAHGPALVAAPRPRPVYEHCSRWVRWHYTAWTSLPITQDAYVGSGVFALSASGHERVAPFPDVIAEDQYVRRRFRRDERAQGHLTFDLHPSRTVRALVHRAARGRAGNTLLDPTALNLLPEESDRGLRSVLPQLRDARRWPAVLTFTGITVAIRVAGARKVRSGEARTWNRDDSSRMPA